MNILKKLTNKNLKLNKKRTIGTIIGVILSTAMLCAVATMVTSFKYSLMVDAIETSGYYHLSFDEIDSKKVKELELNKEIKDIYQFYNMGYASYDLEVAPLPYFDIKSANKDDLQALKFKLAEGRYPRNSSELLINEIFLGDELKIGAKVKLDVGKRVVSDGVTGDTEINSHFYQQGERLVDTKPLEYTIVGSYSNDVYTYRSYAFTTGVQNDKITAYLALKNPKKYDKVIPPILGYDDYRRAVTHSGDFTAYEINTELLRWEALAFSDSFSTMLYTVAGVVIFIIMVSSIFCIRNSFAISTTEKMKMYGMLSSVGATRKQIKKCVIYEGLVISLIGIPIGILCGLLGDFILFKVVNLIAGELIFASSNALCFKTSILAIFVAVVLGFLTVYFSSIFSARKASKVSPIENLRSSNEVKIKSSKLKTPKIIEKLFKTGGVLAYKNLKRSKKKYRTTVISLTVSIFVFISMSAFINEGFKQSGNYYQNFDYNFQIYGNVDEFSTNLNIIKHFKNIDSIYLVYDSYNPFVNYDKAKINILGSDPYINTCEDKADTGFESSECKDFIYTGVILLDDDTFASYLKKNKLSYDKNKDKAIIYDTVRYYDEKEDKQKVGRRLKYEAGDVLELYDINGQKQSFPVGAVASESVYGQEGVSDFYGSIILNQKYYDNIEVGYLNIYIDSDKPNKLAEEIENFSKDISYHNLDEEVQAQKAMILVISIFLYGFIAIISLVGVTNIFNTITSNMDLRAREFAMLKSIGMTKKEFNRMVNLETILYSSKSLFYGIILGIIGSIAIHKAFSENIEMSYQVPYSAILISVIFVFVIVYIIMRYSIRKINKQNTIETIRNENA